MRITGGSARGRLISGPPGLEARPTASKIRQAFFNILRDKIIGARFLDLCAGTGLIGLEALSRGAKNVIFVEESRKLARAIELNIERLGYEAEIICGDTRRVLPTLEPEAFDVVFADPPYRSKLASSILRSTGRNKLLAVDGVLVIEHAANMLLSEECEGLVRCDHRQYGQSALTFYKRAGLPLQIGDSLACGW